MAPPATPYQPYAESHKDPGGPGDARPSSMQILKDCNAIGALKGKTVLITGCSAGLGVETARAMYEAGATVFAAARDMKKLDGVIEDIVKNAENKSGPKPQPLELHLDSLDSVRKAAEEFKQKSGGQLNILINNAGVMAAPYGTTQDGLETQIGVNHFAHFLLFQLLKPLLLDSAKKSGSPSRVINVTSAGHRFNSLTFHDKPTLDAWNRGEGYVNWGAYGSAKTANIWMANAIDRKYGSQGIHAWSVHPGGIQTELARHLTPEDFAMFGEEMLKVMMTKIYKSTSQGAATTVWVAVSPHFEGKNGGQYLEDAGETTLVGEKADLMAPGHAPHAYDEEKEEGLWKLSCEVVGVSDD
ncbi:uncharacterized protein LTR77_004089 [Saxophila tyrrhenica]|uniref:Short-chain dehydrogenase n=1 Tax=Saxophila tyrrhenica TaxID=1690608 RepID=A0AAV9PG10_9PEZI|nr:hypothetical protein LTR77_004089 [Saxophila tyrrhenica]